MPTSTDCSSVPLDARRSASTAVRPATVARRRRRPVPVASHAPAAAATPAAAGDPEDPNVVRLMGRVGADPAEKELPSGDHIVTWRVIVEQPAPTRKSGPRSRVDTIDCIAWSARVRRTALTLSAEDRVVVQGCLRRRFWQTGSGPASRYEVEVTALRRDRTR